MDREITWIDGIPYEKDPNFKDSWFKKLFRKMFFTRDESDLSPDFKQLVLLFVQLIGWTLIFTIGYLIYLLYNFIAGLF
jgi:hypothetical protein